MPKSAHKGDQQREFKIPGFTTVVTLVYSENIQSIQLHKQPLI